MLWIRLAVLLAVILVGAVYGPALAVDVIGCTELTNGRDDFNGTPLVDRICALADNDNLDGRGGDDELEGDTGNDNIQGDEGDDKLFGNEGDDILRGGDGNDDITGGPGLDELGGNEGNDRLFFQGGDVPAGQTETVRGGDGADTARFFFGAPGTGACPKKVADPVSGGRYKLKKIETCTFGP